MTAYHDFPPTADARSAPLDQATLVVGLAVIAARSPTGRAQARVDGADQPNGLAALVIGTGCVPASFHPLDEGERRVDRLSFTNCKPFSLQRYPSDTPDADPSGQRERP